MNFDNDLEKYKYKKLLINIYYSKGTMYIVAFLKIFKNNIFNLDDRVKSKNVYLVESLLKYDTILTAYF